MKVDVVTGGSGSKAAWFALLLGELQQIIWDARWLLLAIVLCIVADFRFGWGECAKRHAEAVAKGNETLADKYRWRGSRAWRRTMNKATDYLLWVAVGMLIGKAIIEPFNLSYMWGGTIAATIAISCEACSFFGHFFYLHGVQVEQKTIRGFFRAFAIALAKRKNEDIGAALEEAVKEEN